MIGFRRAFAAGVSISATILACSGGSGSSTGLGGSNASDVAAFADDFCAAYAPCCAKINKPTDGATCKQLFSQLTAGETYDPASGQTCLNDVHARQSAADFCTNPTGTSTACKNVFREKGDSPAGTGTKQPGETCSQDGDCATSTEGEVRCASSYGNGTTVKACQIAIEGGREGDAPCLGTKDGNITVYQSYSTSGPDAGPPTVPSRGYICDVANNAHCDAQAGKCARIQELGGPCDGFDEYQCVKTAYCDYTQKKCVARVGVGGDCSKSSYACTTDTRCDQATRKCTARLADGSDCTMSDDCISDRCVNKKCAAAGTDGDLTLQLFCAGTTK